MPIFIKQDGVIHEVRAENVRVPQAVSQAYCKVVGHWQPMWSEQEEPEDPTTGSSLPPGVPRWGVAQFSDTDFTGGKQDPNMDGQPYQRWTGAQDFIDTMLTETNEELTIELSIDFPNYGYFACKASDGLATFLDSVNGWPGGWDGAQWEDGGFGMTTGPLTVLYDDGTGEAEWYVYRTDFSGIGDMGWSVTLA